MPLQAICANWVDLLERATSAIVGRASCSRAPAILTASQFAVNFKKD